MPYERQIETECVHFRWTGQLRKDDLVAISRELPELAATLGYAPNVLHTFAGAVEGKVEPWALFEHSIRRKNTRLQNPARVAWVADQPHVRMVALTMQELNRNPEISIEIFETEKAARRWLNGGEKPHLPAAMPKMRAPRKPPAEPVTGAPAPSAESAPVRASLSRPSPGHG